MSRRDVLATVIVSRTTIRKYSCRPVLAFLHSIELGPALREEASCECRLGGISFSIRNISIIEFAGKTTSLITLATVVVFVHDDPQVPRSDHLFGCNSHSFSKTTKSCKHATGWKGDALKLSWLQSHCLTVCIFSHLLRGGGGRGQEQRDRQEVQRSQQKICGDRATLATQAPADAAETLHQENHTSKLSTVTDPCFFHHLVGTGPDCLVIPCQPEAWAPTISSISVLWDFSATSSPKNASPQGGGLPTTRSATRHDARPLQAATPTLVRTRESRHCTLM